MPVAPRTTRFFSYRIVMAAVLVAGVAASVVSYRLGRAEEDERAEAQFARRVSVRHALIREVLSRYEESLFGLSALFMLDANVTRAEFVRASSRLEERIGGVQSLEWVPVVTQENRAAVETGLQRAYARRPFHFVEFAGRGQPVRAGPRPVYYPIAFVHPLRGNETAPGVDLRTGPTLPFLERARETRQMVVTAQVQLLQDAGEQLGAAVIFPVFRTPRPEQDQAGDVFMGFLQCVFRVQDFLENARSPSPDAIVDMLFVDASEPDPAKRVMYYRPADDLLPRSLAPDEAEFRRGRTLEQAVPFGGRDWRVMYRPRTGWVEEQRTFTPILRSASFLVLAGLLAGLVQLIGRRTDTIRREVAVRTAELAESRRQFANMLHALPGMAYRCTYDDQLTVLFVSEGARALTGWSAEEFVNGTIHFRDLVHPDDLQRVREITRLALHERRDVEVEYRVRTRSGDEKWVLSRGRGVYSGQGRLDVFEGLAIDITAQKSAEDARLALERKLLEGQKLESLGLLAGGIAHDFNNLLSTILGNASLARISLPPNTAVDPQLRSIETASLRAGELCRQMLAYAGKGKFVIEPTDLTSLTEDLLPLLRISIARQATLTLHLARNLPPVMADATQLRQIVMNLVLNAADAIAGAGRPDGGGIVVTTGVMQADHAWLNACVAGAGLPGGEYVFLRVQDTGSGMPPDVLAKIFDPFFTTKFAGRGLGLAAVLGIVRGHNGALRVESTPHRGSTFQLLLPPVTGAEVVKRSAAAPADWNHEGTVLVVDDEEPVRTMAMQMLKTFGLVVVGAPNGSAGVDIVREDPAAIDLVLLDALMPGLDGEQTLEQLRQIKPGIRVLLMSGYSEGDLMGRLQNDGPVEFLPKPFTREALEARLRELLG
jgi:two-component system, cell cycle sensor histidine kinase and response regulator CckA